MEQEVIYRIALSRFKGINKALAQHIHETVESLETFFELPESQLQKITGIKGRILHEDNRQTALQEARKEMEFHRAELSPTVTRLYRCPTLALLSG